MIESIQKIDFSSDHQMIIYNDNLQIIQLLISEIVKIDTKLRYIDIAQCWLRKSIQRNILKVTYLLTTQMIADEMTKLLSSQKHKEFIKLLRLVNAKHLIDDANWDSKLCKHRVSNYFKSSINIKKTGFRASMFILTTKHFLTKAIISRRFQHRFQNQW